MKKTEIDADALRHAYEMGIPELKLRKMFHISSERLQKLKREMHLRRKTAPKRQAPTAQPVREKTNEELLVESAARYKTSPEGLELMKAMWEDGAKTREIAEAVHIPVDMVYKWFNDTNRTPNCNKAYYMERVQTILRLPGETTKLDHDLTEMKRLGYNGDYGAYKSATPQERERRMREALKEKKKQEKKPFDPIKALYGVTD